MYIRAKKKDGRIYYYIVEGIRINGRVKQKVILYLGTAETVLRKLKSNGN